ncbi:MAG: 30S ribosomal protein S4 [Anaerolineae bacterium]
MLCRDRRNYVVKFTGSKVKRSRSLGIALTPKAAEIMERRPNPPGQHGGGRTGRGPRRESDFKRQLMEKQRLKAQYNIAEAQMRNYMRAAVRRPESTADALIQLLESRLDAVVMRGGLARTIYAARQYVSHGHIEVNGKRVNIPSYRVRVGDVVSVREKSRSMVVFEEAMDGASPPEYLDLARDNMAITLRYLPKREEVPVIAEIASIIEFYSR